MRTRLACLIIIAALAVPAFAAHTRIADAFDGHGKVHWSEISGAWQVRDGSYHLTGTGQSYVLAAFDDVTAQVSLRINRALDIPADWAGLFFGGDGRSVPSDGYEVYVRYSGEVELFTPNRILASKPTDAHAKFAGGKFIKLKVEIKSGHFTISVDGERLIDYDAPVYRPGAVGLAGYDVDADFRDFSADGQTLGDTITGEVFVLPSQEPVAGAKVDVYNSTDGYNSPVTRSTTTDAHGRYTFSNLPAGKRAYWLRAAHAGYGGTTGWFISVSDTGPTTCDLFLLPPPRHDVWIDSADMTHTGGPPGKAGFVHFAEPQCYGGGRIQVKQTASSSKHPEWWAEFDFNVPREGTYVPYFAAGLYHTPNYWSDFWWSIDGAKPARASDSLTIDGQRYGDRAMMTWAYAAPIHLRAGRHRLRFILRDPAPHNVQGDDQPYWWAFDAACFAQLPTQISPTHGHRLGTSHPTLRWRIPSGAARFTVQVSAKPDFSNGTMTLGGLTDDHITLHQPLADGVYYWRVKALPREESLYASSFGPTSSFTVATSAPAISDLRVASRTPTSLTVEWRTDEPCKAALGWGLSCLAPSHTAVAEHVSGHTYRARLTGLAPITFYYVWAEATNHAGHRSTALREGFCTPRGFIDDRNSPFGIFGQGLIYSHQLGAAGARWYSDYWDWGKLNPARGKFDWAEADHEMQRADASHVNLMVTTWGTPAWVRPSHPNEFTYGPDNLNDARAFFHAAAAHCRGRMSWWLPWIEPNVSRDPTFGFPHGYWSNRPLARTYAAYQRAAYEGLKAGNPDCRVVGMETAGVDYNFIRKCYDEGAADSFDVMNVHYYAMTAPFENQHPEAMFAKLRALMSQYGDAEKPILCSEGGGASSGMTGTTEATQADNLIRIYVISIANHIDRLCWTFELDTKPYGSKRVDMIMWMGLFRFDPRTTAEHQYGKPKPAFFAFKTMTSLLTGTRYQGSLDLAKNVRAYRFVDRKGNRVTVAWCEKGTADVLLPVSTRQATIVDRTGKRKPLGVSLGQAKLHLTGSPVFILEP